MFSSIFTVIYRYFFYVTFCVFKLNVRFYLLCIHIGNFIHCALYVFFMKRIKMIIIIILCMYVCYYVCLMLLCMCMCVGVWEFVCMYMHTYLYILYLFCTYGVFCYVMRGGGGYCSFCILYVLLFDDFLQ